MRCSRVQQLYDEYSSGEMPLPTVARIEEHLAGCPTCREQYDAQDTVAKLLRSTSEVAHPGADYFDDLNARVLAKLREPQPARLIEMTDPDLTLPRRRHQQPLFWMGGMAAAALLTLMLMPGDGPADLQPGAQPGGDRMVAQANPPAGSASPTQLAPVPITPTTGAPAPSLAPQTYAVEDTADGRRELMIQPSPGGLIVEQAQALPTPTTRQLAIPTPQAVLDKGVGGSSHNDSIVEAAIASGPRMVMPAPSGEQASPSPSERRAVQETEVKLVALRRQTENKEVLPTEIFDQLQAIKSQMGSGGDDKLVQSLRELEETVRNRMADSTELAGLPVMRQASLYLRGEEALQAGRPMDASAAFKQIQVIDGETAMSMRARLQLADLFYSEWADFKEAQTYYAACAGKQAAEALSAPEREHVSRQLERLKAYQANGWEALQLLHAVRRTGWSEAHTALTRLIALPHAAPLLPEASRTLVERLNDNPKAPGAVLGQIYTTLAAHAPNEPNPDVRAWLMLALGDLAFGHFQDSALARDHYRKAAEAAPASSAAQLASSRLEKLSDRMLIDTVR